MYENIYEIYDPEMVIFRKQKKKTYEMRMTSFRERFGHYVDELLADIARAEDKEAAASKAGIAISTAMFEHFAKRGKIGTAKRSDLTLFMIYYVFPAIQMTGDENAKIAADGLLREWADRFECPDMGYTTYEELLGGFNDKIFGLF